MNIEKEKIQSELLDQYVLFFKAEIRNDVGDIELKRFLKTFMNDILEIERT